MDRLDDASSMLHATQLTMGENSALLFLLMSVQPDISFCLGTENAEFVLPFSKHSKNVYLFDSNLEAVANRFDKFDNVSLVKETSNDILPNMIHKLNADKEECLEFVFMSGERNKLREDINSILKIRPQKPIYILIHNSFNPSCRSEIMNASWEDCPYIHNVEIDYIAGVFHNNDALKKQMWGGFSLAILRPEKREESLLIHQSNKQIFDITYKQSVHAEPFKPSKILMDVNQDKMISLIKGKKIVFFGTGSTSQRIFEEFPLKVEYFVDNDSKRWGNVLQGLTIRNPLELLHEDKENLAIVIVSQYVNEISIQLTRMGFEENFHYWNGFWMFTMNRSLVKRYFYNKYTKNDFLQNNPLKVSVVIPNYNYSPYLKERIYSIVNQTYRPSEIIFLDDASTDDSVAIADKLLKNACIPYQIIANEKNHGCFKQWIKGIALAQSDILWIAEADDSCRLDFLQEVLAPFADLEVNVSYSQSKIIDGTSNIADFDYIQYTDDLSRTKWKNNYCQYGQDEVIQGIGIKNTIPNASGVLLRKSALRGIEEVLGQFSICGDWLTYLYALRQGKIAFCADTLNYHRRHERSIICREAKSLLFFEELGKIKKYIADNYLLTKPVQAKFFDYVEDEFERLGCSEVINTNENPLARLKEQIEQKLADQLKEFNILSERKRILFVILHLEVGGAEIFPIRLANYLAAFHDVYLYCARPFQVDDQVQKMVSPNVYQLPSNGDPRELASHIKKYSIEIINSHAWWADKLVYKAICDNPNVNWVVSMHGLYEYLDQNPNVDEDFNVLYVPMMKRVNHMIYAADKNAEVVRSRSPELTNKLHKILNGYTMQSIQPIARECITSDKKSFIFGLVSRAIPEKGWEESIQAIVQLNRELQQTHHLVLIGKSEFSASLKHQYGNYEYIHFIEEFSQPFEWLSWVQAFDVGLLPTYFVSESMPIAIMEYLTYEKPVISTNIGEIKNMLNDTSGKSAGLLLELNEHRKVCWQELMAAMKTMVIDAEVYQEYKKNTKLMIGEYGMPKCAERYYNLFCSN